MLPACRVLTTDAACTSYSAGALKARASSQTVSSVSAEGPLPVLLQQNLARVLVRAGRLQEALGVYERLQTEGEWPCCVPHSALHWSAPASLCSTALNLELWQIASGRATEG